MININGIDVTEGCTVKFRCGGSALVENVPNGKSYTIEDFGLLLKDSENSSSRYRYRPNGECIEGIVSGRLLDIVDVIPPVFDWNKVKWGMAFKDINDIYTYYFCGTCPIEKKYIFTAKRNANSRAVSIGFIDDYRDILKRSPGDDLGVKS